MSTGVLELKQKDFWENVKIFLKNDKVKKVLFIGFLILLFFLISKYSYSVPTPGTGGGGTGGGGTGTPPPTPTPTTPDEKVNIDEVSKLIGTSVDQFFGMIMTQLAVMIANLSAVILALCVLFFTIDFLLKILTNLGGGLSIASLILPNLPSILTFAVIVFLLIPSGQQVSTTMGVGQSATTISATINNYQLITMGTPDMTQLSVMTGFLEMGKQFFGAGMRVPDLVKPSDVLSTIITIPFSLWGLAFTDGIGAISTIVFALLAFGSMFTVMGLIKDMLMAFISYVLVVGLSVILMPFLLFQKTADIGGHIVSNIVNKGLSLAIRIGLIGVVVNIIETITHAIDTAEPKGLNMGTAFQTGFVLMIGMFIAGEGGQVAESVLAGKVANLSAGNFIGGAVGKVMGAGATALVLAKKGVDNLRTRRENRNLQNETDRTNQENARDRNQQERNEATLQSATDRQTEAHNRHEQAQERLRRVEENHRRAVASGDQRAIAKTQRSLAKARGVAQQAGEDLNRRNNELARTQQRVRTENIGLERRIGERNERQNNMREQVHTAQRNRQDSIRATRENAQKRAISIAKALGGTSAGNIAGESAGSVIKMSEKVAGGVVSGVAVAGGVARAGLVLGGQGAKFLNATFNPNLSSEQRTQMREEVMQDMSDMAKHYYKDRVNAMTDTLREKTAGVRMAFNGMRRGFGYVASNGVAGSFREGVNAINQTETMQNLYRDMGTGDRDRQSFRERNDPTMYKASQEFQEEYARAFERVMRRDYPTTAFTTRNATGNLMSVDEIRAVNGIDDAMDSMIKNERANYIQSEIWRNGGIRPNRFNKRNLNSRMNRNNNG